MKPRGYILFEGASQLDGAPIVAIATMSTNNEKTGNMVQTWILRQDIAPHYALKTGADVSICGDCIHRPANQGSCYVTVFQAPLGVYKAYKRGNYSRDTGEFKSRLAGRRLRLGAYGDPAAVPTNVWFEYVAIAAGHTGYTHQWARPGFDPDLLQFVMASADTAEHAIELNSRGIRYFRTIRQDDDKLPREIECLSDSIGKSCEDCLLCDGSKRGKGKSVYINIHGAKASKFNPDLIARA